MEGKTYGIGLRNNPKLVIEDNDILYYSETGENERFSVADSPISEDDLDNALLQDVEHEETLRKLADFAKKFGVNWNLSEDGTQILDNKTKQSPTAS